MVLLLLGLCWAIPLARSLTPGVATLIVVAILGAPACAALTAVLRGITPRHDGARLYVAELFSLVVRLLAFPIIFIIIPLQIIAGLSAFVGVGLIIGVGACILQKMLHARWGMIRSWNEIGLWALVAVGLLVSSVPLMGLASLAEESGISLYGWLTGHVRDLEASAQARLFGTPNAPDSFEEEEIDA